MRKNLSKNSFMGLASLFLLFLFIGSQSVFSEVVIFKSGKVIEGELLNMTADEITIEVFGVPSVYSLEQVESINGKRFNLPPKLKIQDLPKNTELKSKTDKKKSESLRKLEEALAESKAGKGSSKAEPEVKNQPQQKKKIEKKDLFNIVDNEDRGKAQDYFDIGLMQSNLGEEEEALESFRKAAVLNPRIGDDLIDDALTDYYLEKWTDAREKFVRAKEFFQALEDIRKVQLINDYLRNDFDRDVIFDFNKDQPF